VDCLTAWHGCIGLQRRLTAALQSDYNPRNEIESQLVQHIIDCNMRLNRAAAIDANLLNVGLAENTNEDAPDAITESVIAQTRAWARQADSFDKLGRYEARISRQLLQFTRELDRIQNLRKSVKPAESITSNDALASLCTNGQACQSPFMGDTALSPQTADQRRTAVVGVSVRSKPNHWVPQTMTAIDLHPFSDLTTARGRDSVQSAPCENSSASLAA
jgi:hypothetical protein